MSKVSTLADAVASVPTGAHVALSGFATARCVMAFAHEVIRQGTKKLTVSQCVGAMDADILVGAGAVERIVYGGGSRGRSGQHSCLNRAIEQGTLITEELSSLSMTFRYLAGSLGLPFIPIRSLNGSDILKQLQEVTPPVVSTLRDPFTGEDWLVIKPLIPDVAVIQVQVADDEGNAWILGPRWDNEEQVKASKRTIVITEQLVSTETIRHYPERTLIPRVQSFSRGSFAFFCPSHPLFTGSMILIKSISNYMRMPPGRRKVFKNISINMYMASRIIGDIWKSWAA